MYYMCILHLCKRQAYNEKQSIVMKSVAHQFKNRLKTNKLYRFYILYNSTKENNKQHFLRFLVIDLNHVFSLLHSHKNIINSSCL